MEGKAKDKFSGENMDITKSLEAARLELRTLMNSIPGGGGKKACVDSKHSSEQLPRRVCARSAGVLLWGKSGEQSACRADTTGSGGGN